jgi:membrane protein
MPRRVSVGRQGVAVGVVAFMLSCMSVLDRFRGWFRRLRETPSRELSRRHRGVRFLYVRLRFLVHELKRDRADQLAAALTYHTLFSLLPMLALALVVLQAFVGSEEQAQFKQLMLDWMLRPLHDEPKDETAVWFGGPLGDEAPPGLAARMERDEFGQAQTALGERVQEIFDRLQDVDFGSIGLVGLLVFLYAATGLLTTVEESFDRIYKARRQRPLHRRVPLYFTVITVGPIVLLAGLFARSQLMALLEEQAWTAWLAVVLAYFSPLLSAWLLFLAMYVLIPNTKVRLQAAAAGALVSALAVGLTAELFGIYVSNAAARSLYGALALLPLFLFWLYLMWLVVLFGLELCYALQTVREHDWAGAELQATEDVNRSWVLPLALQVARSFERGEAANTDTLSKALELSPMAVRKLVTKLEDAGLLREIEIDGQRAFILARPAHRIDMGELLDVSQALPDLRINGTGGASLRRFVKDIREAGLERARERTLADFVETDAETEPDVEDRTEQPRGEER